MLWVHIIYSHWDFFRFGGPLSMFTGFWRVVMILSVPHQTIYCILELSSSLPLDWGSLQHVVVRCQSVITKSTELRDYPIWRYWFREFYNYCAHDYIARTIYNILWVSRIWLECAYENIIVHTARHQHKYYYTRLLYRRLVQVTYEQNILHTSHISISWTQAKYFIFPIVSSISWYHQVILLDHSISELIIFHKLCLALCDILYEGEKW